MLWVLKRIVSLRRFFWAHKTYVQTDGLEYFYNFTLKFVFYLNLWGLNSQPLDQQSDLLSIVLQGLGYH